MIISIANGRPIYLFMYVVALVALNQDGISTLMEAQQFLAKGYERNKCLRVSSLCNKHNSQEYESSVMFLLRSMPLVFILF
jgi:hypothetical protein